MSVINAKTGKPSSVPKEVYDRKAYSTNGAEVDLDNNKAYALHVTASLDGRKNYRFYIKIGQGGEVQDPWDFNTGVASKNKTLGRNYWNFKRVSEKVYSMYMKFLNTRNHRFLRSVETLLRSGE